jgi:hypothetical protein
MQNFILTRLLKWIAGRLDGYKTIIGGAGFFLAGILGTIQLMWPDLIPDAGTPSIDSVLTLFAAAFGAWGIGHKIEKTAADKNVAG